VQPYGVLVTDAFFAISYSPSLRPLFRLFGMGPARSGVWVHEDLLRVRMGWGFRAEIPRRAVRQVAPDPGAVTGWGAHGWRGQWLVNGSSSGLVRMEIQPAAQAFVMGFPVQLRTLRLSLESPDELTRLLTTTN
jgi:hypothetical protein